LAASLFGKEKETATFGDSERVFLRIPSGDRYFVFSLLLDLVLLFKFGELLAFGTF
jgi:hypothetical protein